MYNYYLDEYEYSEEVGFEGLMLNEHNNTPTCVSDTMNLETAILARITKKPKILLLVILYLFQTTQPEWPRNSLKLTSSQKDLN